MGHRMQVRMRLGATFRSFMNPSVIWRRPPAPPEPTRIVMDKLLAGKNVLVTGVGKNIGRSIMLEMVTHGANVYCTDASKEQCTALEAELASLPCDSMVFCSDITKTGDNEAVVRSLKEQDITVDILVNNVGTHFNDFSKTFETNVFGPVQMASLISQMMIEKDVPGSIIFITSVHQESIMRVMTYSSSKAALRMIIEEMAIDLAPHRIRVNGIAPGYVAEDEQGWAIPHKYTPLEGSSINPRYIGRAAVYLSSEYFSRYTTGTVVKIDAGLSLFNYLTAIEAGL